MSLCYSKGIFPSFRASGSVTVYPLSVTTVLYLNINISSQLLVNILNVEYCFSVRLGGTTFKYVVMADLWFDDHLPSHVAYFSAVCFTKMFVLLLLKMKT